MVWHGIAKNKFLVTIKNILYVLNCLFFVYIINGHHFKELYYSYQLLVRKLVR